MHPRDTSSAATVHRLLFRALLEIRSEAHEQKNKLVFHLADLFHNVVLEMENAAEGRVSYPDVLRLLEERAKEKGLEKWLSHNLADLKQESVTEPPDPALSNDTLQMAGRGGDETSK